MPEREDDGRQAPAAAPADQAQQQIIERLGSRPRERIKLPPVPLVAVDEERRLALATTRARAIIDMGPYYLERSNWDDAFDRVGQGRVPLLSKHAEDHWPVDMQLGLVREGRYSEDGETIELIVEFGHNPRGDWIWRDLCAGHRFGCSISIGSIHKLEIAAPSPPLLPKPYFVSAAWTLEELTICAAGGGRDDAATLMLATNLEEVKSHWRLVRESAQEMRRRALPVYIAEPLRGRVPRMVAAIAHGTGADEALVDQVVGEEIEAFIADYLGTGEEGSTGG
jgi:hypothetical protein